MCFRVILTVVILFHFGASDLVVQVEDGKVQGRAYTTPNGQTFYSWRGIPFAKPPVGELRFMAPEKPEPWDGILDAAQTGASCLTGVSVKRSKPITENKEDCLTVNVYSPRSVDNNTSEALLPVMFWIYGGSFINGSSDFNLYDPTPLVEEGVIVVTSNYRLSVLGFLSTQDQVISGNAGLKDQLLALKWTKDNIAQFGGNPDNITIFGESAGGKSVGFHVVSPRSKNLFSAAIMQSGCSMSNITVDDTRTVAFTLAKKFDSSITDASNSIDVKRVLQSVSTDALIAASKGFSLGPILEAESDQAFMYKPFYEVLAAGENAQVPIIIGHIVQESLTFFDSFESIQQSAALYDANLEKIVPGIPLKAGADPAEIGREIRAVYVGENGTFSDNLPAFLNWRSDELYVRSIYKEVDLQSRQAPVYMYMFSFYGTSSQNHVVVPGSANVSHGDELPYLFNMTVCPIKSDSDYLTRKRLVKFWTNFAKTHNPTPDESSELLQNFKWETTTIQGIKYLNIGNDLKMEPSTRVPNIAFWNNIWEKYSYHPYRTF